MKFGKRKTEGKIGELPIIKHKQINEPQQVKVLFQISVVAFLGSECYRKETSFTETFAVEKQGETPYSDDSN